MAKILRNEMQNKITLRCHLTLVKISKMKTKQKTKQKILVWPWRKNTYSLVIGVTLTITAEVWKFWEKLETDLLHDTTTPLEHIPKGLCILL